MDEISPMPLAPKAGAIHTPVDYDGNNIRSFVRPEKAEGSQFGQGSALLKGKLSARA